MTENVDIQIPGAIHNITVRGVVFSEPLDIVHFLQYAYERHCNIISYHPQMKLLELEDRNGIVCSCTFNGNPFSETEKIYIDLLGLREAYIKFRLQYPQLKYLKVTNTKCQYLIGVNDTGDPRHDINIPVLADDAFMRFANIVAVSSLDLIDLDMIINYNYRLKNVINKLRVDLDELEKYL